MTHCGIQLRDDESCAELVRQSVLDLGFKYAKLAEEAKSTREATSAFRLAEKAFRLALDAEKQMLIKRDPDKMGLIFLSQIHGMTKRSLIWVKYLDYCTAQNLLPMNKGQLFKKLEQLGFVLKKSNGEAVILPPRKIDGKLLEARSDASNLGIDIDFEAP
jgi:hypothetical protein